MTPDDLQSLLAAHFAPWVQALDITVVDAARFRMPLTPALLRTGGIVSGQALAALADTAMVLSAIAHAGRMIPFATTNLDTQFLRPGSGSAIVARCEVVRAGKALVFMRCTMEDADTSKAVATASATLYAP